MSNNTVSIGIQTTFQDQGIAAAQRELARLVSAQQQAARATQASGTAATAAERELLRYASALARSQAASGNLAGAEKTLSQALQGVNQASAQALQVQTQLSQVQTRAAKALQDTTGAAGGLRGALNGLAAQFETLTNAVGQFGVGLGAVAIAQGGVELIKLGAQAELVRTRFDALARQAGTTGDALLAALRKASGGEIDDLNLQLAANRAIMLGVADSAEEFSVLMAIARDRAQQLGLTTSQAFNDLVVGLGRGSAEILDNLGIVIRADEAYRTYADSVGKPVSALTAIERKQSIINAVLLQGKDSLDKTGGAAESAAGKIQQMETSITNLKTAAGGLGVGVFGPFITDATKLLDMLQGGGIAEGLMGIGDAALRANPLVVNLGAAARLLGADMERLAMPINVSIQAWKDLLGIQPAVADGQQQVIHASTQYVDAAAQEAAMVQYNAQQHQYAADAKALYTGATTEEMITSILAAQGLSEEMLALNDTAAASISAAAEAELLALRKEELRAAAVIASQGMGDAQAAADALAMQFNITTAEALRLILALRAIKAGSGLVKGMAGELGGGIGTTIKEYDLRHPPKAPRGGRRGGGGGARISDQQKLNNQLLSNQEKAYDRLQEAAEDHHRKLLDIEKDYAEKSLQVQRQNEVAKRQSRAGFYDSLTSATKDIGGTEAQRISAEYEAAYQRSQEIAQAGDAKLAADYLALKEQQLEAETQYQQARAQAIEEGDKAEAERLDRIRELQRQAEVEQEAQLMQGGDANANERARQIEEENARYQQQQADIAMSAENAAERKITAAERSAKAIDKENLALQRQAQLYNQIGAHPAGAVPAVPPAGAAATPMGAPGSVPVLDVGAIVAAIEAQSSMQVGKFDSLINGVDAVERAISSARHVPIGG